MRVAFKTPQTIEDLSEVKADLELLHHFVPYKLKEGELQSFCEEVLPGLTVVYLNKWPIGCFTLYPAQGESKRVLELHGVVRPDLKDVVGRVASVKLLRQIYDTIFYRVFVEGGKDKIIAKIPKESRGALVFVKREGFTKINNVDRGRTIWKLEKKTYVQRKEKEAQEG